ncbi:bifunctional ribokinase/ribose-5-phosphate isomerase A [Clostridiales bacterium]|nr:bifunctional ribokinase/ribose-5-phosphate isomerase A [Clostridiales bacterium]
MKKVLVIGSTVADIIVRLSEIPTTGGDINIKWQKMALGGCAFNVSQAIAFCNVPYLLFSPTGTGIYADYVRKELERKSIPRAEIYPDEPNGCCYCLVEDSGERTFICEHGTEYRFKKKWFELLKTDDFECAYICGLEIEEKTGDNIVDFLESSKLPFYFAPGPRINKIESHKMDRIFSLAPILHVNRIEALSYTNEDTIRKAAERIVEITKNDVIITDGENGSFCLEYENKTWYEVAAFKTKVVDTIGAGDSHIGTYIARRILGDGIRAALLEANKIASIVVQKDGARLDYD